MDNNQVYDVIIIGSGPAGLTAALYAGRSKLNVLVLAGTVWGGQLMTTTLVENYPGFPDGVQGPELMNKMLEQAKRFVSEVKFEDVTKVELTGEIKKVHVADKFYSSKVVIIATGATPKMLNVPGEDRLWTKGVSSCATCDGAFYRNMEIAVVGGGDTAMEEATFLTRFASKVHLIHRRDTFRASKIMQEKVLANPKIEVIYNTEIKEVLGDNAVSGLKLFNNKDNKESELKVEGLFLAIGHIPLTKFLAKQLEVNEEEYLISPDGVYTSIDGVFLAGDVEDHYYRQAVTAAGAGCKAAIVAERWLSGTDKF
ncbi:MAG: thioredoxin-disulfide reductase [Candidatus Dojkabacteria bacterium]